MSNYGDLKEELFKIKSSIDKIIEANGINNELLKYEKPLNEIFKKINSLQLEPQDKNYISFNFYSSKSYIYLAKGCKFKGIKSYITALQYYIQYLDGLSNWNKWNFKYYSMLGNFIEKEKINIFGNTSNDTFNDLIADLMGLLNTIKKSTLPRNIKDSAFEQIISLLFSIVSSSSELYSENHLKRADEIIKLIESLDNEELDNYQQGILRSINFMLLKRKLHFYLRQMVPSNSSASLGHTHTQEEIEKLICEMKRISNLELKSLKKINSRNQDINFRKFLAKLDQLSVEYYENLWVHEDFIKVFKTLEKIFTHIRKNVSFIYTPQIFSHFAIEYEMLINYYKLHLLKRDFENFGRRKDILSWQREISLKVTENLQSILTIYKYKEPKSLERDLLIVEKTTSGKFIEFVVLYLLKEFIEKNVRLNTYLQEKHDKNLREFFNILDKVKHERKIKWGYKTKNNESDIDILIEISTAEKYGLFIKSGILNNDDFKKVRQEISFARQIKLKKYLLL